MKYYDKLSEKEKILYILCRRSCQIDMSGADYITTTGALQRMLKMSQYKIRKYLKEYEKDGLVARACEGGCADDELRVWCIKGWCITNKARYLEMFKYANWEESKIMRECWDIVPSQYYATNTAQWFERQRKEDEKWDNIK